MEKLFITTERLFIRNLKPEDLPAFHSYRSNPDVVKYQSFGVMDINEASNFIEIQKDKSFGRAGEWVQYGIENRMTHEIIGDCAIRLGHSDTGIAEIGITISHLEQRKGFAKEAMLSILKFLFEEKNIHRVIEIVDEENEASINLMKSIGYRMEGHFIENIFFKGRWGNEFQFAMLKKEWE